MDSISHISGQTGNPALSNKATPGEKGDFKNTLNTYLNEVNGLIGDAGDMVEKMTSGEVTDLHQVMVAVEKASIGLDMVMEIRNKLLESYREFMRMQV